MKKYKKIGLGFAALAALLVSVAIPHKALAVTAFSTNPFAGAQYIMQGGKITTTIAKGTSEQQSLTFSNSSSAPLVYSSNSKIFCASTSPNPGVAATMTLPSAPSGTKLSG